MNTSYQPQIPKHHRIMTGLAEIACVCLILASIIVGLGDALQQAQHSADSRNDLQSSENSGFQSIPGGSSDSVAESGEGNYSFVVINPDKSESGSTSTDAYLSGSFATGAYEAVTDENGNTHYQYYVGGSTGENGNLVSDHFVTLTPVGPGDIAPIRLSYTSTANNLSLLLFCFLPCVLLLLYTLHLYQKPHAQRLMAIITGIYAAGFLVDAVSSLDRIGILSLLWFALIPAALTVLLGILTVMFWKGTTHRTCALATFILAWLSTGYNLLNSARYLLSGGPVINAGRIIYTLGMLAFQVALFVYAYRKVEAAPADTPDGNAVESESDAPSATTV